MGSGGWGPVIAAPPNTESPAPPRCRWRRADRLELSPAGRPQLRAPLPAGPWPAAWLASPASAMVGWRGVRRTSRECAGRRCCSWRWLFLGLAGVVAHLRPWRPFFSSPDIPLDRDAPCVVPCFRYVIGELQDRKSV